MITIPIIIIQAVTRVMLKIGWCISYHHLFRTEWSICVEEMWTILMWEVMLNVRIVLILRLRRNRESGLKLLMEVLGTRRCIMCILIRININNVIYIKINLLFYGSDYLGIVMFAG